MTITTTDHAVPHISKLPINSGQTVNLFVRERDGTRPGGDRTAVLMLHGRSVPVLPSADLGTGKYNWMLSLARAGFDVFAMDLQGHGRSPRPDVMQQPCNTSQAQQQVLLGGNPLTSVCTSVLDSQLGDSRSDWSEVETVVKYIKKRHGVSKVALMGWSAAALALGPYAIEHSGDVSSLFLLAPVFGPNYQESAPGTDWDPPFPLPLSASTDARWGFPMNLTSREGFERAWNRELGCPEQREDGMVDTVWDLLVGLEQDRREGEEHPRRQGASAHHVRGARQNGEQRTGNCPVPIGPSPLQGHSGHAEADVQGGLLRPPAPVGGAGSRASAPPVPQVAQTHRCRRTHHGQLRDGRGR
jgi:pimeloyl-ACP methyl ester carboxylesterase